MKIRSSSSVFLSDGSKHFFYPNILLEGLVVQPLEAFVVCVRCKVVLAGFRHAAVGVAVEGHAVRVLLVLVDETLVTVHHVERVGRGHGGDEAAGGDGGLELLSLGSGLRKVGEVGIVRGGVFEVGIVRGGVFEVGIVRGARHVRALLHHHLAELTHEQGATATFHSAPVAKVDETGCAGGHILLSPLSLLLLTPSGFFLRAFNLSTLVNLASIFVNNVFFLFTFFRIFGLLSSSTSSRGLFFTLGFRTIGTIIFFVLWPGPARASTTCAQFLLVPGGNCRHLFTIRTQALQMSPVLSSLSSRKQFSNSSSYLSLSVNRELLDLALQMQQPSVDR